MLTILDGEALILVGETFNSDATLVCYFSISVNSIHKLFSTAKIPAWLFSRKLVALLRGQPLTCLRFYMFLHATFLFSEEHYLLEKYTLQNLEI